MRVGRSFVATRPSVLSLAGMTPLLCSARRQTLGSSVGGSYFPHTTSFADGIPDIHRLGFTMKPQDTLPVLWSKAVAAYAKRRFIGTKMWVRGKLGYVWSTYESIDAEIAAVRTLLHKFGVRSGSRVVCISENRYEWFVVHMATLQLGAQFVALPTNVTPTECRQVIIATQATIMFVESIASFDVVKGWAGEVGILKEVFCFEQQLKEGSYSVAVTLAASVEQKPEVVTGLSSENTAMTW